MTISTRDIIDYMSKFQITESDSKYMCEEILDEGFTDDVNPIVANQMTAWAKADPGEKAARHYTAAREMLEHLHGAID